MKPVRILFLALIPAVAFFGCASGPEYGINASPGLKAAEGKESGRTLEQQIKKENEQARERGDPPIFRVEDRD